jgi:hypothetical protein
MSLCETCTHADTSCPVWYLGKETESCHAYHRNKTTDEIAEEIRQEDS